jgi:beta-glucosidase
LVGYRYYNSAQVPVAFPFGYGLSYTTFDYTDLVASPTSATVTIRNTGPVAGAEVVQLYVERRSPGLWRPRRELKGFARVELEPGQAKTVTIALDQTAFRHYAVAPAEDSTTPAATGWQVETGQWAILIGANVEDIRLEAVVDVDGTVPAGQPDPDLPHLTQAEVAQVTRQEFEHLLGRPLDMPTPIGRLNLDSVVGDLRLARSGLARLIYRQLQSRLDRSLKQGKPDLNLIFMLDLPFRNIAKLTGGMVDRATVQALIQAANGSVWSGLVAAWRAYRWNRRANRQTARQLAAASTNQDPPA